ncbi:pyrimidine reductase family protein [Spirillospora sp. CA-294931]|uniref:pyrimidine reductase family protein n=1 Tax=Spirillospora sp. CA-294931 TaxID=3240042 RepID=UPI003D91D33D
MRRLSPAASAVDLADEYAYPPGRRWLRANMVSSADGAAVWEGRSGGLAGPADQRLFSLLRGLADVVIVGAGTVRAEGYGPARPGSGWPEGLREGRPAAPAMAVVSRDLALDFQAPIFTEAGTPTLLLTCEAADPERMRAAREHAEVVVAGQDAVDFAVALLALEERGHTRLLCEGGPIVLAQIAAAGLLDELCLTLSPRLAAGAAQRVLNGVRLPEPADLRLGGVLEDDDFLFLRYLRKE